MSSCRWPEMLPLPTPLTTSPSAHHLALSACSFSSLLSLPPFLFLFFFPFCLILCLPRSLSVSPSIYFSRSLSGCPCLPASGEYPASGGWVRSRAESFPHSCGVAFLHPTPIARNADCLPASEAHWSTAKCRSTKTWRRFTPLACLGFSLSSHLQGWIELNYFKLTSCL